MVLPVRKNSGYAGRQTRDWNRLDLRERESSEVRWNNVPAGRLTRGKAPGNAGLGIADATEISKQRRRVMRRARARGLQSLPIPSDATQEVDDSRGIKIAKRHTHKRCL